jgi:hypothetical protein
MNKSLVGGTVKKPLRTFLIIFGAAVLLIGYWGVDNFVYPIKAVHPNYSDVERVFAQLQFPSDWKEISSSEGRGLHGRDCDPFNKAGCFHKAKKFKVPDNTNESSIQQIFSTANCVNTTVKDITPTGDLKSTKTLTCSLGKGLSLNADLTGPTSEVYVAAQTF